MPIWTALQNARLSLLILPAVASLSVLAGCAKGPTDGPTWSLTGSRAMAPVPPEPMAAIRPPDRAPVYRGGRDPSTGLAQPQATVDMAPLPPPTQPTYAPKSTVKPGVLAAAPVAPAGAVGKTADGRLIIDVRPGDTLTGIAAAHRVSVAGLMFTNNLRSPVVEPGMRLALPPR